MVFAILTFAAALFIEGLGSLISVIGLSALFGANPIIIALAVALDVGKLVVVTLLYKYWRALGYTMRAYGLVAALVTMTITSAGAAGYLSGEFQKAVMGVQEGSLKVDVLKGQIAKYEERKKQIDNQIAAIPEKYSANQKIRLMNQFKAEQKDLQDKIAAIDKDLPTLQIAQIGVEAKAGPVLYISKAFNVTIEEAVKWVILLIIIVFDPLAVFLIIAGNFLWDQKSNRKEQVLETTRRRDVDDARFLPEPVIFPAPPNRQQVTPSLELPPISEEVMHLGEPDVMVSRTELPAASIEQNTPEVFAEVNKPELNLAGAAIRLKELDLVPQHNDTPSDAVPSTITIPEPQIEIEDANSEPVRPELDFVREVPAPEPEVLEPVRETPAEVEEPKATPVIEVDTVASEVSLEDLNAVTEKVNLYAAERRGEHLDAVEANDRLWAQNTVLTDAVGLPMPPRPSPAPRWHRGDEEGGREQITLSSLSKVKPDPATKTGSDGMPPLK